MQYWTTEVDSNSLTRHGRWVGDLNNQYRESVATVKACPALVLDLSRPNIRLARTSAILVGSSYSLGSTGLVHQGTTNEQATTNDRQDTTRQVTTRRQGTDRQATAQAVVRQQQPSNY